MAPFSSLPSIKEISGGKYTQVQHFEDKAAVEKYLKASGVPNASIMTGFFVENFLSTYVFHVSSSLALYSFRVLLLTQLLLTRLLPTCLAAHTDFLLL